MHWKLHELSRVHSMPNNACAIGKHAHLLRCMRCVKVFGLQHLVKTVCKKKWWLSEIMAQAAVANWLAFYYFREIKDSPYSEQRVAFGWALPLPPAVQPAGDFSDSDAEMQAALDIYERDSKQAKV